MRKNIALLTISLLFFGCDSKSVSLVERSGLIYEVNSEKPYSGSYHKTQSITYNGQPKTWTSEEGYYKDGKLDGKLLLTDVYGGRTEIEFKNGLENGKYIKWLENGQKLEDSLYADGKLNGRSVRWHANGQSKYDCIFVNGYVKDKCVEYNQNGVDIKDCIFGRPW